MTDMRAVRRGTGASVDVPPAASDATARRRSPVPVADPTDVTDGAVATVVR